LAEGYSGQTNKGRNSTKNHSKTILKEAIEALMKGEVFTEFFLMSIATIGAIAIGQY